MEAPSAETVVQLFDEFDPWFRETLEQSQPDLVVAIARGASRLLELHARGLHVPVVSQHAIPFMEEGEILDKRILVFDDSIIFGSTMAEVAGYLQARGATVSNAAYVVDRTFRDPSNPNSSTLKPLVICKELNKEQVRIHHAELVHKIYQKGLDLNLDFPTLKVSIGAFSKFSIPFIAEILNNIALMANLRNVTHPVLGYNGVERWTANNGLSLSLKVRDEFVVKRPNFKIRITFIPDQGEILFTPIVQLAIHKSVEFDDIEFNDEELNRDWRRLAFFVAKSDPYYSASLLRLLSFFEATIHCRLIAEHVKPPLVGEFGQFSSEYVDREPQVVLGDTLSGDMVALFQRPRNTSSKSDLAAAQESQFQHCESDMAKRLVLHLPGRPHLSLQESDPTSTLLAKLFKGLRELTDSDEIRSRCTDSSRLKTGLSIEDICFVLESSRIERTDYELSCALDFCIDRALVVPKNLEHDSWIQRLFYCGEDGDNDPDDQLRQKLHQATREMGLSIEISKFDFQKICATTKHVLEFLPLQTTPNNFGMTCVVGEADLLTWLTPKVNAPFLFQKDKYGNWVLVANKDYAPAFANTWNVEEVRRFFEAFQNVFRIFAKIKDEEKLLLSTCGSISRTFDANAYEIYSWAGKLSHLAPKKRTFSDGLYGAATDLKSETISIGKDALERLYWSVVYSEECLKKVRIWESRRTIRQQIENRIDKMKRPELRRWWDSVQESLVSTSDDDVEYSRGLAALATLAEVIRILTACAIRTLALCGVVSKQHFDDLFQSERLLDSKSLLNFYVRGTPHELQDSMNSHALSLTAHWGTTKLPALSISAFPRTTSKDQRTWAISVLEHLQNCRRSVSNVVEQIAPETATKTAVKRFSPGLDRELAANGKGLRIKRGVYLLSGTRDRELAFNDSERLKDMLRTTAEGSEHLHVDLGSSGVFKAYSGYPADIAVLCSTIQRMNLGIGLIVQFGDIRTKMAANCHVGTIEPDSELQSQFKDIIGRLDTALMDDPNLIACDDAVFGRISKHLPTGSREACYRQHGSLLFAIPGLNGLSQAENLALRTVDHEQPNTFKKTGDFWTIVFEGREIHLRDAAGMQYLSVLLAQPNTTIPVTVLFSARSRLNVAVMNGSSGETLDAEALKSLRERAADIVAEMETAREDNDDARVEEGLKELEFIESEVNGATGLGGKARESSDFEKVRKAVSNAISRAIESISKKHDSLGKHLTASVSKGSEVAYEPASFIRWETL